MEFITYKYEEINDETFGKSSYFSYIQVEFNGEILSLLELEDYILFSDSYPTTKSDINKQRKRFLQKHNVKLLARNGNLYGCFDGQTNEFMPFNDNNQILAKNSLLEFYEKKYSHSGI